MIKGCWSGEPFTFSGKHYQVKGITCPQPQQDPYPPLLIAGAGRRMLRFAGREADIVGISPLGRGASGFEHFGPAIATSGERIEEQLTWIKDAAGDRFEDLELSVMAHHLAITDDVEGVAADLAQSWGSSPDRVLKSPHVLLGSKNQIVETLLDRRQRYGISYVVFGGGDLDSVESIVGHLAGT